MAHQVPHQVPVHVEDRRLPNGAKVDFGHGAQTRKTKPKPAVPPDKAKGAKPKGNRNRAKSPLLPNGDKPDYSSFNAKPTANGDKPIANGNGNKLKKKQQQQQNTQSTPMALGDSYAGSSFHLSPEAVALPKPTFKTKLPPPSNLLTAYPAGLAPATASPMYPQRTPYMMNQPVPGHPQPQHVLGQPQPMLGQPQHIPQGQLMPHPPHPIPANVHPGFTYQVNPQGFIVYPPQPGAGPVPGYGGPITTHFQQPMPQVQPTQQQGQRITFADLMGSQK